MGTSLNCLWDFLVQLHIPDTYCTICFILAIPQQFNRDLITAYQWKGSGGEECRTAYTPCMSVASTVSEEPMHMCKSSHKEIPHARQSICLAQSASYPSSLYTQSIYLSLASCQPLVDSEHTAWLVIHSSLHKLIAEVSKVTTHAKYTAIRLWRASLEKIF